MRLPGAVAAPASPKVTMRRTRPSRAVLGLAAAALVAPAALLAPGPASAAVTECSGLPNDINGDGFGDVAIGELNGGPTAGGRLHVLYGTPNGSARVATGDAPNDQVFAQGVGGVPGKDVAGDLFGSTVLVDDFNGDGCADVVAAAQGNNRDVGAVVVLYGSITGLRGTGSQLLDQDDVAVGEARFGEQFGALLTSGDFNADGVNDLVVGSPGDIVNPPATTARGAVTVFYGSPTGFDKGAGPDRVIDQSLATVPDTPETGDGFGTSLAAGDLTGDGVDDLVVGVPGENDAKGIVQVIPGGPGGLGSVNARTWSENTAGVPGTSEPGDTFGWSVAVGDVDGDGGDDLVVGVPGENRARGSVVVLRSNGTGPVVAAGAQVIGQDSAGVDGVAAVNDIFAFSLAIGPLDGDAFDDVAIGTLDDTVGSVQDAGSVTLLRGSASGLSTAGYGGTRVTQQTAGVAGTAERGDAFGFAVATTPVQGNGVHQLLIGVPGEDVGSIADAGQSVLVRTSSTGPTGSTQTLGANTAEVTGVARSQARWGIAVD